MIVSEIRVAGFGRLAVCAEFVADFFSRCQCAGFVPFQNYDHPLFAEDTARLVNPAEITAVQSQQGRLYVHMDCFRAVENAGN
jgi:hypothetical protein